MPFTSREVSLYKEMLRQAQLQSMLMLAATNASIEQRERKFSDARMDDMVQAEQEIDERVAERESSTLFALNDALERLREPSGMFGRCEECGGRITPERSLMFPWSMRCEKHSEEQIQ